MITTDEINEYGHQRAVDYKFRNLPCNISTDSLCSVNGEFRCGKGTSFGVLEWCWNEDDAKHIITEMNKDSRFSNLTVVDWR